MKAFERIFLYSVLMVLVVYVFLVDGNVESKVAIQDHFMAKRISIMNNEGQEVVLLWTTTDGIGPINIVNKTGTMVAGMTSSEDGDGRVAINNKAGTPVALMAAYEDGGGICVTNKAGMPVVNMTAYEYHVRINILNMLGIRVADMSATNEGDGAISVYNRYGKGISSLP